MRISDWSSDVCSSDLPDNVVIRSAVLAACALTLGGTVLKPLGPEGSGKTFPHIFTNAAAPKKPVGYQRPADEPFSGECSNELICVTLRGRPCNSQLSKFARRAEEHTSELQSLMRISHAAFCLKKKNKNNEIIRQQ